MVKNKHNMEIKPAYASWQKLGFLFDVWWYGHEIDPGKLAQ